jgi:hypothetical protein
VLLAFYSARGALGRADNGWFNGFNSIDGREGLRGGLIRGFKVGEGECLTHIMRRETKAMGMAGGNE